MPTEHIANVAGRGGVSKLLELATKALVAPGVLLGQADDQCFGLVGFARTSWAFGLVVESPFLLLLATVPGQKRFGFGNGHDLAESIFDPQSVFDQDTPVRFGQRHAGTQLSTQDSILLAQVIILQNQVAAGRAAGFWR